MDSDVIYCIHSLIGVYRRLFGLGAHSRPGAYYWYDRLPPGALSGQALFWDPALFRAITVYTFIVASEFEPSQNSNPPPPHPTTLDPPLYRLKRLTSVWKVAGSNQRRGNHLWLCTCLHIRWESFLDIISWGGGGVYHNLRSNIWPIKNPRSDPWKFVKCCCCGYSKQHPQHHTTTHFVKCCCCGYSKQHPQHHTTTHFVKCCCCGYSKQHPQHHTTTHFVKCCCCGYSKQHPQHHTTTHFVKCCCCGYSKQHPQHHTTTHFVKCCCCGYSKQHPRHHTTTHFVNVVVVCHLWTIVRPR